MARTLAALLLLAAAVFFCSASASSDSPFMVAHKKVSLSRLKSGAERVSVSIDIYNQGSATAYDVSLDDNNWPQDLFDLVCDSPSKTWEMLDSGSIVSHSFVLESKVKGIFPGTPAVVKYRVPMRTSLQEAYSTPILPLDILADKLQEKKLDLAKRLAAKYGPLVSVIFILVIFMYLIASPSHSSKGSKKRR